MQISEKLRLQLLKEEFKLRKKQPQAWTVQKYRKYANIGIKKKKEKKEFIEEEKDFEAKLLRETRKEKKSQKNKEKSRETKKAKKNQGKAKKTKKKVNLWLKALLKKK